MTQSYYRSSTPTPTPRPVSPLESLGIVWGWTTPLTGPALTLRPLWPRGIRGWIAVDRPDGSMKLAASSLPPELASKQQQLLRDVRDQLPAIVTSWAACLIDQGGFVLRPDEAGCRVIVHPGNPTWQRSTWFPVDWEWLIGAEDPRDTMVWYEPQGPVALLGGRGQKMKVHLARLMWRAAFLPIA